MNRITDQQKLEIKEKLSNLQSKKDLVGLCNDVSVMIYGETTFSYQLKHFTYYANPKNSKKRYQTFTIKKKSGTERQINAPVSGLKSILKCFSFILESVYEPRINVTGFVCKKSVVDNAKLHVNKKYVYNIDLSDFFHSFDRNRVKMGIWKYLFNYDKNKEELSFFLAALCTHPLEINGEIKIVLPQGSPVSPILTNILCQNLDRRLNGFAKKFGVQYSRYADDITFSGNRNVFREEEFKKELFRIVEEDQKLQINPSKTRLQGQGFRQEVTGVIVNDKLNVHRNYVKQVRMWIYYMEKYGLEKADSLFRKDYIKYKGHVKYTENPMLNVIAGKLQYLKMVKGENDTTYQGLKTRFEKVTGLRNGIDQLLQTWEREGIDAAMNAYEQKANG